MNRLCEKSQSIFCIFEIFLRVTIITSSFLFLVKSHSFHRIFLSCEEKHKTHILQIKAQGLFNEATLHSNNKKKNPEGQAGQILCSVLSL